MYETTVTRSGGQALRRKQIGSNFLGAGLSVLATVIGLLFLAWAVLFITKGRFLKPTFESYLSRQTLRQVRVAGDFQLYLNPINIKFYAEGLTISNPAWASRKNFFAGSSMKSSCSMYRVFEKGTVRVPASGESGLFGDSNSSVLPSG